MPPCVLAQSNGRGELSEAPRPCLPQAQVGVSEKCRYDHTVGFDSTAGVRYHPPRSEAEYPADLSVTHESLLTNTLREVLLCGKWRETTSMNNFSYDLFSLSPRAFKAPSIFSGVIDNFLTPHYDLFFPSFSFRALSTFSAVMGRSLILTPTAL